MTPAFPRLRDSWRFVLVALVALVLLWRVLAVGMEGLLGASGSPEPQIGRPPLDAQSKTVPWRERLARYPTDGNAMLMLALELEREDKRDEAEPAMRQALRMAPADQDVLMQAADYFLRAGDGMQALPILRRMVNLYPGDGAVVWPVFTEALETGAVNEFFEELAKANPPWWQDFFRFACENSVDTDGVERLLVVRFKAGSVTDAERRCVIGRLQREDRWADARAVWLDGLPDAQRKSVDYIFNGGFELPLTNLGFDWILPVQDGVAATAQPTDGVVGRRALQVAFVGKRYERPPAYQMLMLLPGSYRLAFRGRVNGVESWLGLQWGLYCGTAADQDGRQLLRSDRFVGSSDWSDFQYDFVVPRDCMVQVLRLELANPRRDADTPGTVAARLRGTLFFDEFSVRTTR